MIQLKVSHVHAGFLQNRRAEFFSLIVNRKSKEIYKIPLIHALLRHNDYAEQIFTVGFLPAFSYLVLSVWYGNTYFIVELNTFWDFQALGWRLTIIALWINQLVVEAT